jgi:hypothetical protein
MTTLQEFVSETLIQIVAGVAAARDKQAGVGVHTLIPDGHTKSLVTSTGRTAFMVEFDVAVTATDKTQADGKAGISVVQVFNVGGEHSQTTEHSSVSRVKFTVPIDYV